MQACARVAAGYLGDSTGEKRSWNIFAIDVENDTLRLYLSRGIYCIWRFYAYFLRFRVHILEFYALWCSNTWIFVYKFNLKDSVIRIEFFRSYLFAQRV